ncbi:hypothetical protein MRX96_002711 [Rhipicephalus microplus]
MELSVTSVSSLRANSLSATTTLLLSESVVVVETLDAWLAVSSESSAAADDGKSRLKLHDVVALSKLGVATSESRYSDEE